MINYKKMVNDQIKAKTGTSSKLKKMYENSSKNTQSRLLVEKKSKKNNWKYTYSKRKS